MGDLYSIDEGAGVYFNLADEYDTPNDAETAASAVGHPGVAMLRSIYLALPAVFSDELSAAKAAKDGGPGAPFLFIAYVATMLGTIAGTFASIKAIMSEAGESGGGTMSFSLDDHIIRM